MSLSPCGLVVRYNNYALGRHRVRCHLGYTRSRNMPVAGCKATVTRLGKMLRQDLVPIEKDLRWNCKQDKSRIAISHQSSSPTFYGVWSKQGLQRQASSLRGLVVFQLERSSSSMLIMQGLVSVSIPVGLASYATLAGNIGPSPHPRFALALFGTSTLTRREYTSL